MICAPAYSFQHGTAGSLVASIPPRRSVGSRIGGIALEHAELLSVHAIAAVLYPAIAVGLPAATYLIARGLTHRIDAAVVAATAHAAAIWIDYALVSVASLPVDVVLQRMLMVTALGLIAAGAANRDSEAARNNLLGVGSLLWVGVLAGTLFGVR